MNWMHKFSVISQRLIQGIGLNQTSIRGKNNQILNHGSRANVTLKINGNNNYVEIGKGAKLSNLTITVTGNNHRIIFKENCIYRRGNIAIWDSEGELIIGQDTTIEGASFSINEPGSKITVGRDCMFSNGIRILVGDLHSILDLHTKKRINYSKDIVIGEHVWISASAIILKGVTIGDSAIVGAGAVVTKNVESNCIVAGNPAQLIKRDICWTRERSYNNSKSRLLPAIKK